MGGAISVPYLVHQRLVLWKLQQPESLTHRGLSFQLLLLLSVPKTPRYVRDHVLEAIQEQMLAGAGGPCR
jgi:hypothetical protein